MVNQIPIHLGNVDKQLVDYCRKERIMVESYSPLAHARLLSEELRRGIYLEVYNQFRELNAVQIFLSYASNYADVILPKASSMRHMLEDLKYQVHLNEDVIARIEQAYDALKNKNS